jgi:hypothetical protein
VETKADLVRRIADRLGVECPPMSSGSTEPKRIFELVVSELGLPLDSHSLTKPDLARGIVEAAGLSWNIATCESTGGTVTKPGVDLVWRSVQVLLGDG